MSVVDELVSFVRHQLPVEAIEAWWIGLSDGERREVEAYCQEVLEASRRLWYTVCEFGGQEVVRKLIDGVKL